MLRFVLAAAALCFFAAAARAQNVSEHIYFLSDDGRSFLHYQGVQSGFSSYNIYLDKGEALEDYLYFFPNAFAWDRDADPANDILRIGQGDYSYIEQGDFGDLVTVDAIGDFHFYSDLGEDPDDPRYGFWTSPAEFTKFVYVWVLPANLEVIEATSNRQGDWVRRNNAIAWFGENTNNVSFQLRYRAKTSGALSAVRTAVGDQKGVAIGQSSEGVRLTLADTVLFESGSAALNEVGAAVVANLAGAVDFSTGLRAVVEGHTDNVPLNAGPGTAIRSNWELSAARALAVVQALEKGGAPSAQLEARAFGEHQPVADNATPEGRAANRRINILITSD
ncbi:MAG: flagellar motor protein MotB [Pseudomonadota bacterium]